jgi:hypothetical protein
MEDGTTGKSLGAFVGARPSRCTPCATPNAPPLKEITAGAGVIPPCFNTGKSPVSHPNTHRNTGDMPVLAGEPDPG